MKKGILYSFVVVVFVLTAFTSKSYLDNVKSNAAVVTTVQCPSCAYFKQQIDITYNSTNGNKCAAAYCTARGMMKSGCASNCDLDTYALSKDGCSSANIASYCALCTDNCN